MVGTVALGEPSTSLQGQGTGRRMLGLEKERVGEWRAWSRKKRNRIARDSCGIT